MRNLLFVLSILLCILLLDVPSSALEKRAVPVQDGQFNDWNSGSTCRIRYWNICTGWVWCWGPFDDDLRLGVVADRCCEGDTTPLLLQTMLFLCSSAPLDYGFTGTIAVHSVDANDCPTSAPIAVQPYCPNSVTPPFSVVSWPGVAVPNRFAVVVTIEEPSYPGPPNPALFGTDHPMAGPTGPPACGQCYPANRVTHSYSWGTNFDPLCPGETFNDGLCNAELFWDLDFACTVSVQETSWGSIKALYR